MSNNYIEYKSNSDSKKNLSVEEYLYKIRPYLKNITNNMKKSDTCKIYWTITINFISSKDENDDEYVVYSEKVHMKIMINDKKVIKCLFKSFKNIYQDNLKKREKAVSFSSIIFIYWIAYTTKKI